MTRCNSLFATLLLAGATSALSIPGLSDPPAKTVLPSTPSAPTPATKINLIRESERLPLSFESNQGQTNSQVRFLTRNGDSSLFLTPSEAVFTLPAAQKPASKLDRKFTRAMEKNARMTLRMQIVGANPKATALAQQPLPKKVNYLIGKDPKNWHTNVPTFGRAGFQGVYPGVDVVYYGNKSRLEYDFMVAPHADPKQIALRFAGAQGVRVNAAGELLVRMDGKEMRWEKPTVYQQDATGKHSVAAHFRLKRLPNGQAGVGFALGRYDTARPLVIDPVLLYSTYLAGSTGENANAISVDGSSGYAYVAGSTSSSDFPITVAGYQQVNYGATAGYTTAFVTKLTASGSAEVWSTYLGGSTGDSATGIAADSGGNAYVTGITGSSNFPTTSGAFQTSKAASGNAAFVAKINASGTGLYYSTYLSGTNQDGAYAIAFDSSGYAYVTGFADSSNFPTTSGAFQTTKVGTAAFVTKLNIYGTGLIYSTFIDGGLVDYGTGITVDNGGKAYVTGATYSSNFPTTSGAFQVAHSAPSYAPNAFVTKVNPTGTALVFSTYLGGSGSTTSVGGDVATAIAIDSNYNPYVTGYTLSTNFPTTSGAYQVVNNAQTDRYNAFVTKLNSAGTGLVYSTYLGGNAGGPYSSDGAYGIAVDSSFNAYVTGEASSRDFPTVQGVFQRVNNAPTNVVNAFITKLNAAGSTLMYSSFLGGSGYSPGSGDGARGIGIDPGFNAYVTGTTYSTNFPVTSGAFQTTTTGGTGHHRAFVTKLSSFPVFPDVNNDGFTDLLFQDSSNVVYAWYMNGRTVTAGSSISIVPAAAYKVVGTGDFTRTGHADLLFQNQTTGDLVVWYLNGPVYVSGSSITTVPSSGYKVVGVADFNRDGWPDILFQSQTTGQIVVWFMNGTTFLGGQAIGSPLGTNEKVVGTGDFNYDGQPDIVTQLTSTGQVNITYMNQATISGSASFLFTLSGTLVLAVADYNNDGYADLVVKNPSRGDIYIAYMQNTTVLSNAAISTQPPSTYQVVGPH